MSQQWSPEIVRLQCFLQRANAEKTQMKAAAASAKELKPPPVTSRGQRLLERRSWRDAPTSPATRLRQLYPGNWEAWLYSIRLELEDAGLWIHVRYPPPSHATLTEAQLDAHNLKDTLAVNIMMARMDAAFKDRIQCDHNTTAHEYFKRAWRMAQPFRFTELPRELRDKIYEHLVARIEVIDWFDETACRVPRRPPYVEAIRMDRLRPGADKVPALLHISRQIRIEASEIYYQQNHFLLTLDQCAYDILPLEAVSDWASVIGTQNFKHLRKLSLYLYCRKELETLLELVFSPHNGLQVQISGSGTCEYRYRRSLGPEGCIPFEDSYADAKQREAAYCAMIESRRTEERWDSTGIIEFFLADTKASRHMRWGPRPNDRPVRHAEDELGGATDYGDVDDPDVFCLPWWLL